VDGEYRGPSKALVPRRRQEVFRRGRKPRKLDGHRPVDVSLSRLQTRSRRGKVGNLPPSKEERAFDTAVRSRGRRRFSKGPEVIGARQCYTQNHQEATFDPRQKTWTGLYEHDTVRVPARLRLGRQGARGRSTAQATPGKSRSRPPEGAAFSVSAHVGQLQLPDVAHVWLGGRGMH